MYLGNIQPELQLDVINKVFSKYIIAADSMNLWISLYPEKIWELISKVDLFMLNDEEAIQLTNKKNLEEIANDFLKKGPKIIIIKLGGKGSLVAYKNKKVYVSIVPETPIYDPTGAGDSFAGGFIGHLEKTQDTSFENMKRAVIHGSAMASFCVEKFGTERLKELKINDVESRLQEFVNLAQFDIPLI